MRISDWSSDVCSSDLTVAGERIWRTDPALRQHFTDLQTFTSMTPEALGRAIGQDKADAVIAYLRANPQALRPPTPASLAVAREKLAQSLAAYRAGDRRGADPLAPSAYLDGFRSDERRVGKEGVRTCNTGVPPYHKKK